MHHFLQKSCFLFKLRARARLILVRNAAAEQAQLWKDWVVFLVAVFEHMECYFNSAFLSKMSLESFPPPLGLRYMPPNLKKKLC